MKAFRKSLINKKVFKEMEIEGLKYLIEPYAYNQVYDFFNHHGYIKSKLKKF